MSKISFWIAFFLCILFSILFFVFPQIDIKVSTIFFQHGRFLKPEWMGIARHILALTIYSLMAVLIIIILWSLLRKKYQMLRPTLYLLLCFALGPGLLVNVILKDHWGRPRPICITQFGGKNTYQKPWVISHECKTNCSFVAGEPAAAFTFFAFLVFFKKKNWRKYVFSLLTLNWLLFSYIRIAQGGHFLSDVLIGATLMYMLIWSCYYLLLKLKIWKSLIML